MDRRIYKTKLLTHFSLLFLIFYLSCNLNFSCDAQNLPFFFVTVTMLSTAANCSSRKAQRNFRHEVNYRYCCLVPGLESTWESRGLGLSRTTRR